MTSLGGSTRSRSGAGLGARSVRLGRRGADLDTTEAQPGPDLDEFSFDLIDRLPGSDHRRPDLGDQRRNPAAVRPLARPVLASGDMIIGVCSVGDQRVARSVGDRQLGPGLADNGLLGHSAGPEDGYVARPPALRGRRCAPAGSGSRSARRRPPDPAVCPHRDHPWAGQRARRPTTPGPPNAPTSPQQQQPPRRQRPSAPCPRS